VPKKHGRHNLIGYETRPRARPRAFLQHAVIRDEAAAKALMYVSLNGDNPCVQLVRTMSFDALCAAVVHVDAALRLSEMAANGSTLPI
jgi:hypothetical protein